MAKRHVNYWDYIKVEELLALQQGVAESDEGLTNDEVRFIAIHQIDELWFKLALRELISVRDLFRQPHVPETSLSSARAALRRIAIIFGLATDHFRLMETMRTQDYLKFRDKLSPASGFQSAQMREIEVLLGLDGEQRLPFGNEKTYLDALKADDGSPSAAFDRVQRRIADRPSVKEAVYEWLYRTPIQGSRPDDDGDEDAVGQFLADFLACHGKVVDRILRVTLKKQALTPEDQERLRGRYEKELANSTAYLQAEDAPEADRRRIQRMRAAILFIESNRSLPLLSWPGEIIDSLIAAEQAMLVFRQRHARMVERVIGRRTGTGGSDGVEYLDQTALHYRIFREVWAARTLLLDPEEAPPIRNSEMYGFSS